MKRLILVLVMVMLLSGCSLTPRLNEYEECIKNGGKTIYYTSSNEKICTPQKDITTYGVILHEFSDDYDYWLIKIVSREYNSVDRVYTYGIQEYNDDTNTFLIESTVFLSIDELALAVELSYNNVILIDFEN